MIKHVIFFITFVKNNKTFCHGKDIHKGKG